MNRDDRWWARMAGIPGMNWRRIIKDAIERRRTLRELRSLQKKDKVDGYWTFKNLMTEALSLVEMDRLRRAKEIWDSAYARFPEEAMQSELTVRLLLKLRLYSELEALMIAGQKRHPGEGRFLEGLVLAAYERGDRHRALELCEVLRRKHPYSVKGYSVAAAALSELGSADAAEEIFARALKMLPNDPGLHIEYAKLAERRKDWQTALDRWSALYATSGHLAGAGGTATALAHLGRFGEADTLINSVKHKSGSDYLIWLASARVAEIKGDWEEAALRWDIFRQRLPVLPLG